MAYAHKHLKRQIANSSHFLLFLTPSSQMAFFLGIVFNEICFTVSWQRQQVSEKGQPFRRVCRYRLQLCLYPVRPDVDRLPDVPVNFMPGSYSLVVKFHTLKYQIILNVEDSSECGFYNVSKCGGNKGYSQSQLIIAKSGLQSEKCIIKSNGKHRHNKAADTGRGFGNLQFQPVPFTK